MKLSLRAQIATAYDKRRLPRWLNALITMNAAVYGDIVVIRYYFCGFTFYKEVI